MSQLDEKKMGRRLQAARQTAGMTQQALCQRAGLSYSTLAKIERGAIKSPSIFTIQQIATALGTSLDELVGSPLPPARQRQHSKSGIGFVYLDVNGCLVHFYHRAFTEMAVDSGQTPDQVETVFWHYNDQVCRGDISMAEFNKAVEERLGLEAFDFQDYYLRAVEPVPQMAALAEWVSQHYGLGLLTNIMPGLLAELQVRKIVPTLSYDAVIDSSVLHAIKPERRIYEIAEVQADCPASEILFVDDSRVNLMAAEKLGWRVMWFDDLHPDEAAARIRDALVLPT